MLGGENGDFVMMDWGLLIRSGQGTRALCDSRDRRNPLGRLVAVVLRKLEACRLEVYKVKFVERDPRIRADLGFEARASNHCSWETKRKPKECRG